MVIYNSDCGQEMVIRLYRDFGTGSRRQPQEIRAQPTRRTSLSNQIIKSGNESANLLG